jgi:putative CocE/NonD family hydrolase
MGPWTHGSWARSEFFHDQIEFPFFQHYLKDSPDPNLPKAYVFETGKNIWRKEQQWPPEQAVTKKLYLQADKRLSFEAPQEETGFDQYESDPGSPVPFFNKPTLEMAREYMSADQRFAASRPDVLTYQTEPLGEDLVIAGPVESSLFVSTTGTDSDFVVKLIDVMPDGVQQLVRGEPFRGKFRHSFEHPEPFRQDEIESIRFTMPDVYHCFGLGHRVMVQIQSSWFPLVDRNPQTFTDIPYAKPSDYVKATERIYRSQRSASSVEVNVLP